MNNMQWGLEVTVLGMGLVFALLALLWGLLTLVLRMDPVPPQTVPATGQDQAEPELAATAAAMPCGPVMVQGMDAGLVAAILVATLTHRAVRRREAAPEMRSYWPGSLLYASRWVGAGRAQQNRSWQRRNR